MDSSVSANWREAIQKLDNVTWFGHCVIHITHALRDLPTEEARLLFIQNLERYIAEQRRGIRHYERAGRLAAQRKTRRPVRERRV